MNIIPSGEKPAGYGSVDFTNDIHQGQRVEESFPALKEYKTVTKCLDAHHLTLYGDQAIFLSETKKSVKEILSQLKEVKAQNGMNEVWFKDFLIFAGKKRHEIADLSHPAVQNENEFGDLRSDTSLITPLTHPYSSYIDKIQARVDASKYDGLLNSIKLEGAKYKLVGVGHNIFNRFIPQSIITDRCYIVNVYDSFWEDNDPVFKHTFKLFNEIIDGQYLTPDELKDKIAGFHWLFANVAPYKRGSAWCGEVLTDACWLYHGYVPPLVDQGKSLDMEAMSSDINDYLQAYPMGHRV